MQLFVAGAAIQQDRRTSPFYDFSLQFKSLSKVFLRCVSPSFSIFCLAEQDGVEPVVKFGRLNIMEATTEFSAMLQKGFILHLK